MAKVSHSVSSLSKKQKFFFARVFPWLFLLPGAVILFFGLRSYQESRASQDWPSVEGEIRSSEVVSSRSSEGGRTYRAEVTYRYTVDGVSYTGDRIQASTISSSSGSRASAMHRKYPKGKSVKVFYNPERPDRALLEPGASMGAILMSSLGGLFFVMGSLMVVFLPKLIRHQEKLENEHQAFREEPSPVGISREPLACKSTYSWVPLKFISQSRGSASLRPGTAMTIPGVLILLTIPVLWALAGHFNWDSGWRLMAILLPLFGGVPLIVGGILIRVFMTTHSVLPQEQVWRIHSLGNPDEDIPLDDIIAIQVIPGDKAENSENGQQILPYQINLVLTEDRRKNLLQTGDRKGSLKLARKIAGFLKIPLVGLQLETNQP